MKVRIISFSLNVRMKFYTFRNLLISPDKSFDFFLIKINYIIQKSKESDNEKGATCLCVVSDSFGTDTYCIGVHVYACVSFA